VNGTAKRPGFTRRYDKHSNPETCNCMGANHHDYAQLGTCDGCGREIARLDDGRTITVIRNEYDTPRYACWASRHECDPEAAERTAAAAARSIASGEIVKGQTVTVVKGRKVPKGTTGVVNFVGDSPYGWRVGFRAEDGVQHFTAIANVEAAQ
jgi:hypothetical protein